MTGPRRPKAILSPTALARAMADVLTHARRAGTSVALVGGYALQFYGSDRLTADVDVIADRPVPTLRPLRRLPFGGYATKARGVPVDIILRNDEYAELYQSALAHAVVVGGTPIVLPEYLVALKMAAARDKDELDLKFLLTSGEVNYPRARAIVAQYLGRYAARELDALLAEAEWLASRGR